LADNCNGMQPDNVFMMWLEHNLPLYSSYLYTIFYFRSLISIA
jgi:hypothetical protein